MTSDAYEILPMEHFVLLAKRHGVDPDLFDELYPIVADLLRFSDSLNRLAVALGQQEPTDDNLGQSVLE